MRVAGCWLTAGVVYGLLRAPLLPLGSGNDFDAWTVAANAADLVRGGAYRPSRFPGHPLHEYVYSYLIVLGGPLAANVVSVLLSGCVLACTLAIGLDLGVARRRWAVVTLALHPVFWIASTNGTDGILAAALSLVSCLLALRRRSLLSGVALAAATAARPETAIFVAAIYALGAPVSWRRFLAAFVCAATVLWSPAIGYYLWHSPPLWAIHIAGLPPAARAVLFVRGIWVLLGPVALVVTAGIVALYGRAFLKGLREGKRVVWGSAVLSAAYAVITALHPSKPDYYLPLLPFVLLAIASVVATAWRWVLTVALASFAVIYPDLVDRTVHGYTVGFKWSEGLVVRDAVARLNSLQAAATIESQRPRGPSVTVLGYWLPVWRYGQANIVRTTTVDGRSVDERRNEAFLTADGATVVHNLPLDVARSLRVEGVPIAVAEGAIEVNWEVNSYDVSPFSRRSIGVRQFGPDAGREVLEAVIHRAMRVGHESSSGRGAN